MNQSIDQLSINTIRTLSMDAVQQANWLSRHADVDGAGDAGLWQRHLKYDPADPLSRQPRPLGAVHRPCLDAALFDVVFGRCAALDAERRVSISRR